MSIATDRVQKVRDRYVTPDDGVHSPGNVKDNEPESHLMDSREYHSVPRKVTPSGNW